MNANQLSQKSYIKKPKIASKTVQKLCQTISIQQNLKNNLK